MWPPDAPCLSLGGAVAFLVADPGGQSARDATASRLLGDHAGAAITVSRRASGRPRLAPPWPELGISLSHRDAHLLIGFNPSGNAGADLEHEDDSIDALQLARDHFSAGECAALTALVQPDRQALFFRLWCAKEAVLKATDRGIADGMQQPDFAHLLRDIARDGVAVPILTATGVTAQVATRRLITQQGRRLTAALAILS